MKTISSMVLSLVLAGGVGAQVLPPDALLDGKTLGEWNAEYWKWLLPISTNENPALDPDGRWAHVGQPEGPVWFLPKGFNITRVGARALSVPEGKYVFAPLITVYSAFVYEDPPWTVEQLRAFNESSLVLISGVHCTIDGVSVPDLFSFRAQTPVFSIEFPDPDNLFSLAQALPFTGLLEPMVADGYAVLIEPLPPGTHVIRFGGTVGPPVNLLFDFTDTITIVSIPLEERVGDLIAQVEGSDLAVNRKHPLLSSLNAARESFESNNSVAGANQMNAFVNKVRAQVAPESPGLAEAWTDAARGIMDRARGE